MRLFIAINFKKGVRYEIQDIIEGLKLSSIKGKFVKKDHLHLTLEFFGDISEDKVGDIINIMNKVSTRAFSLKPFNIGYFNKRRGNIYWIGFKKSKRLLELQKELHNMLRDKGFKLEDRPYTPHITIGRKVVLEESVDLDEYMKPLGKIRIKVSSIELMKSEHINGQLIYTALHSKKL